MLERFILGCLFIGLAFVLIIYRRIVREFFGSISILEKYFRNTEDGLTVIGILIMIISFVYMIGGLDLLLKNSVGRLFN